MKKVLLIIFYIIFSIVRIALWPIRLIWRSVNWRYRAIGGLVVTIVILVEVMTPAYWLALTQYYEARGESWKGRYAVANVVFNRVEDRRWPNTIKEVINDGRERGRACDFSFMCDGKDENPWLHPNQFWGKWIRIKVESWAMVAVFSIGLRYDPTGGAVYYKRYDVKSPWFEKEIKAGRMKRILGNFGVHEFFL